TRHAPAAGRSWRAPTRRGRDASDERSHAGDAFDACARSAFVTRMRTLVVAAVAVATALWMYSIRAGREDLPPTFVGRTNPRVHDPAAAAEGAAIFQSNCASCHGERADGPGVAAVGL